MSGDRPTHLRAVTINFRNGTALAIVLSLVIVLGMAAPVRAEPTYPEWSEVEKARGDEQATQSEITRISNLLSELDAQVRLATSLAEATRATVAAETAAALADQAGLAQAELDRLSDQAQTALDEATTAQDAARNALAAQQANETQLTAQLATLKDARISIEQGYAIGEQKRQAAQAAQAAPASGAGQLPSTNGAVSPSGWTNPILAYRGYQGYGMRLHPVYKDWRLHAGDDYGASCGTPIYAAAGGTVTFAGPAGGDRNQVSIDHGGGMTPTYSHMYADGLRVRTGTQVSAGQNIAVVGSAGVSTGCYLHFETRRGGVATAPAAVLSSNGVG